jgi:hypothetical protein
MTMDGLEIIRAVELSGGSIWADGDCVGYRIPRSASEIVSQIRDRKSEVLRVLRDRPPSVRGVRVIRWEPVDHPVRIARWATVTDARRFAENALVQIEALLMGGTWQAGNWTLAQLLERLEAVGVTVEIESKSKLLQ